MDIFVTNISVINCKWHILFHLTVRSNTKIARQQCKTAVKIRLNKSVRMCIRLVHKTSRTATMRQWRTWPHYLSKTIVTFQHIQQNDKVLFNSTAEDAHTQFLFKLPSSLIPDGARVGITGAGLYILNGLPVAQPASHHQCTEGNDKQR